MTRAFRMGALLAVGLAIPSVATPAVDVVPFAIQVPLVLKALTYDRSLKSRVTDQVRIAVLSPPGKVREAIDELNASLASLPARSLDGRPVQFVEVAAGDEESLDRALRTGHWAAAYAMPGFGAREMDQIKRAAQSARVLLVAAASEDVSRGMAFGVGERDGKPVMVVNLTVTKACGSEFDLALLRLAQVIQ